MFMKCLGGVGLRLRNIWLDFGTDLDLHAGSIFLLFYYRETGHFKYELKELRMNVYTLIGGVSLPITNSIGSGLNSMSAF